MPILVSNLSVNNTISLLVGDLLISGDKNGNTASLKQNFILLSNSGYAFVILSGREQEGKEKKSKR